MSECPTPERLPGFRLALFATMLAAVVVVLGAFTRLVDAGLGCPDWPGCYGHLLWPNEAHEIARAEQLFPDTPVDQDKTWPEMVHRYFASSLGLVIIALVWFAWRHRRTEGYPFRLPLFLLLLVVWQGMFGMWTVTLKLWPQVVTVHLLGGFTTLSLLWLLTLRLANARWRTPRVELNRFQALKPYLIVGLVLVFLQVALGGWLSSNYAALACADFPTCRGVWWPEMALAQGFDVMQTIGPNYLGGLMSSEARVAIHMAHRVGALLVSAYLLGLIVALLRVRHSGVRGLTCVLFGLLIAQILLGISNVIFALPLPVAVAHNAGGALLLLGLVSLAAFAWMAVEQPSSEPAINGP